jgi:hypothetical protein
MVKNMILPLGYEKLILLSLRLNKGSKMGCLQNTPHWWEIRSPLFEMKYREPISWSKLNITDLTMYRMHII